MKFYIAEGGYYGQVAKRHIKEFENENKAKEWCASECDWIAYWVEGQAPDYAPLGLIYSAQTWEDLSDLDLPLEQCKQVDKSKFQQEYELKPAFQSYHWIWCDSCQTKQYLVSGNNIPAYCTCGSRFKFSTEQFCEHGIVLHEKCCVCEWKGKPTGDGTSFEKKRV